jgi:hypothetical protein
MRQVCTAYVRVWQVSLFSCVLVCARAERGAALHLRPRHLPPPPARTAGAGSARGGGALLQALRQARLSVTLHTNRLTHAHHLTRTLFLRRDNRRTAHSCGGTMF